MPIDYSIPTIVNVYLGVIERLSNIASQLDSNANEAQLIKVDVQYYLSLIRKEMAEIKKESE